MKVKYYNLKAINILPDYDVKFREKKIHKGKMAPKGDLYLEASLFRLNEKIYNFTIPISGDHYRKDELLFKDFMVGRIIEDPSVIKKHPEIINMVQEIFNAQMGDIKMEANEETD